MKTRICIVAAAFALLGSGIASQAFAANADWDVNAAGNWNDDSNWLPAAHPNGIGDIAGLTKDISAARLVTLNGPNTVGTLNIGDSTGGFFAFTLGGTNILTLNNGGSGAAINKSVSTATDVISAPISLADNLSVTTADGALTISGAISETGGSRSLTKLGATTLTLSGANTYTGNTIISGGSLSVGGSSIPDGVGRGNVVLNNAGSTLVLTGSEVINGLSGDAGTIVTGTTSLRILTLGGNSASSTFSGQFTGGGNLSVQKTRDGTLTLNGATPHTYTSQTRVFGGSGMLVLDFANLGTPTNLISASSQLRLGGGTFKVLGKTGVGNTTSQTFTPALVVDGGASAIVVDANGGDGTTLNLSSTFTRSAIGTVDFSTVGTGATIATAKANDAAGILGGYATFAGSSYARQSGANTIEALPDASYLTTTMAGNSFGNYDATSNVDVDSSPILDGAVAVSTLRFNSAAARTLTLQGANTTNGILVTGNVGSNLSLITGGAIQGNLVGGATARDLIVHQYNTAGALEIASDIVDNTAATHLVKAGPGLLRISSTGNSFTGQIQILTGTLQLGNSGVIPDAAVVALNSATLDLNGFSEAIGNLFGLETSTVTSNVAGPVTLTVNGGSLTYPGVIQNGSGIVSLSKVTAANQTLSGANTFTGATTVSAGTLTLNHTNALQNSTLDTTGGGVIFGSAVAGAAFTLGGLSGSGNIALATNAPVTPVALSIGNNGENTTYSGVLSGAGSLNKVGGGTTALDGNNTYAGTTTVTAGTLLINGSPTGTGAVTVNNGGTLGGNGTLLGAVSVNNGGKLAPGTAIGTLTTGDATIHGTLKIDYNGGTIDKLIAGALDITTATVDFDNLGSLTGGPHIFATYTSLIGTAFATITDLPSGYTIKYNYLGGNQIALVSPAQFGDFDADGDVDGADFIAWQTNFPTASSATAADGDSDADGDVDGADFAAWQSNFPTSPGPGTSPVPEPHAFLLLSIGAAAAVGAARKRRNKCSKCCLAQQSR